MEELEEVLVLDQVDEGSGLGGAESRVTSVDNVLEVGRGDFGGGDVEGEDLKGEVREAEVLPALPGVGAGYMLGDVKTTVVGETLENGFFE